MALVVMTIYEACEVIALRAVLLSQGAPTRLTDAERMGVQDNTEIARKELGLGRIDAIIVRPSAKGPLQMQANEMLLPRDFASG